MINKIINWWYRKETKNLTRIPLFVVYFNYSLYKNPRYRGKCDCIIHMNPDFAEDEVLRTKINNCVDYIREKYDMETFTEVFRE